MNNRSWLRLILVWTLTLICCFFAAETNALPKATLDNCQPVTKVFKNKLAILEPLHDNQSTVFVIYNKSKSTLYVNHFLWREPGASAGWASKLGPGHWSAISLYQNKFPMICRSAKSVQQVACQQVLDLCYLPKIKIKSHRLQNISFWVGENLPLQQLLKKFKSRLK